MHFAKLERRAVTLGRVETSLLTSVLMASFPDSFSFWDFVDAVTRAHTEHKRKHPTDRRVF